MACQNLPRIVSNDGPIKRGMKRDREGYRSFTIVHRVEVDRNVHGPLAALTLTPGIPQPGSMWDDGGGLVDEWAFCTQEAEVTEVGSQGNNKFYDVTQLFSSKPEYECPEDNKEDPLIIPDRIKILSVNYNKEEVYDRFGNPIVNSAWEQLRGQQIEKDAHRFRVVIEQNAGALELDLIDSMKHHTNSLPMWGFGAETIKLSEFEGSPKYHVNCDKYYLRRFTFDIDSQGWVRTVLDEGTKVLHGKWDQRTGGGTVVAIFTDGAGAIDTVNIVTPGSGHPRNAIVLLSVAGGTGGVVMVETDDNGDVTSTVGVHLGGSGYSNSNQTTTQRGNWVLLRIGGEIPDPDNPQHFDRAKEIRGENTRYILDGRGVPVTDIADAGSIEVDHYDSANLLLLGVPLSLEIP